MKSKVYQAPVCLTSLFINALLKYGIFFPFVATLFVYNLKICSLLFPGLNLIKGRNLGTLKNEKLKLIDFNKNTKQDLEIIRKYLFENMYRSKEVIFEREKCSEVIVDLFNLYNNDLNLLPSDWQKKIKYSKSESPKRIIGDYISGMTDRFAINQHKVLVN